MISTHTKYAPSQAQWLRPLDDLMPAELVADLLPRPAELSRIDGRLLQIPRNLDVRLLHYRRDLIATRARDVEPSCSTPRPADARRIERRAGVLRLPLSRSRLRTVRHVLRAAGQRRRRSVRRRPAAGVRVGGRALGRRADRRPAPASSSHAARSADWHYDEISASFRAGDAAMVSDWPGSYHLYRDPATCRVADRVGLALLPAGPAGIARRLRRLPLVCDYPRGAQPEAAAALLRHLTSFEAQLGEARRGAIPVPRERARRRARRGRRRPGRGATVALACRNRADDDHSAAVCRVSAV